MRRMLTTCLMSLLVLATYGQSDWETISEKAATDFSEGKQTEAIELLETARTNLAQEKGKDHSEYMNCLQLLMGYYIASGNNEAATEVGQEMQAISTQQLVAAQKKAAAEAQAQRERANQNITSWQAFYTYLGQFYNSDGVALIANFEKYHPSLPKPRFPDDQFFYINCLQFVIEQYQKNKDLGSKAKTIALCKEAIQLLEDDLVRIERNEGKSSNNYKADLMHLSQFYAGAGMEEKARDAHTRYLYGEPESSVASWTEMYDEMLSLARKGYTAEQERFADIIHLYESNEPNMPPLSAEDGSYINIMVMVAGAYEKAGKPEMVTKTKAKYTENLEQLVAKMEALGKTGHENYGAYLTQLYSWYVDNGHESRAEDTYNKVVLLGCKEEIKESVSEVDEPSYWETIGTQIRCLNSAGRHEQAINLFWEARKSHAIEEEGYIGCFAFISQSYQALGTRKDEYQQLEDEMKAYSLTQVRKENPKLNDMIENTAAVGQEYQEQVETEQRKAELEKSEEFETIRKRLNETGRIKDGPSAEVSGSYIAGTMTAMLEGASAEERQEIYDQMLPMYRQMYPDMDLPDQFTEESFKAFVKSTMTATFEESEQRLDLAHEASRKPGFPDNPVLMIDRFDSLIQSLRSLEWIYPELVTETEKLLQSPEAETLTDEEAISILVKAAAQAPEKHPYSRTELKNKLETYLENAKRDSKMLMAAYYPEMRKMYLQYDTLAISLEEYQEQLLEQPGIGLLGNLSGLWPMVQELPLYERAYHAYMEALGNLGLKAHSAIDSLTTESNQMEEIAKYRQMHLAFALETHQDGMTNIFDDSTSFIDLNQLLASKGADYKAKKYIIDAVASGDATVKNKYDQLRAKKAELAYRRMGSEIQASEIQTIREADRELYKQLRELSTFATHASKWIIDWQDIQKMLKPDEAFVNIERVEGFSDDYPGGYWAFVIRKSGEPELIKLASDLREFEGRIFRLQYLRSIMDKVKDVDSYPALWQPIAKKTRGVTTYYLSADGIYHNISYPALFNPESQKYLTDENTVITLSDPSDIRYYKRSKADHEITKATLIGNPDYNVQTVGQKAHIDEGDVLFRQDALEPLPYTLVEVQQVSTILQNKGLQVETLTGGDATEANLINGKSSDVLHIATHGSYMPPAKQIPGLKLSYSERELKENALLRTWLNMAGANRTLEGKVAYGPTDGIVTAEDVLHMDLTGTELVILSACGTGLGEPLSGEGTFNLARSFLLAGAQNVIMTLWKAEDKSTQLFMEKFYSEWLISGLSVREAFNAAQHYLRTMSGYSKPYFWAPFVLIGQE